MLVGEIRSQIDSIWHDFWSGGVSNPLSVIEQITYLLFIKRLDELQSVEEHKANTLKTPLERRIFPEGRDGRGGPELQKLGGELYENLRWSRFKGMEPREMFRVVEEHVFPFIREKVASEGSLAKSMRDARFQIPTPALLARAVDKLDSVPMGDRDTKGDVYEYMLGKIASAGQNGQFRTPRHIIELMTALMAPTPKDVICDPAAGTCGFLVAASEYLRDHHPGLFRDDALRRHFHEQAFHGFDFDPTMLRIGAMNMILHGVESPVVEYRDSLSEDIAEEKDRYSLILANPPFAGSLDYEQTARDLQQVVKTKKTELLFIALFHRLLKAGGRAAVIVPAGVIESDSSAHTSIRRMLVEEGSLEAIISLPHWIFKPYASVSTAILVFGKGGATERVWFYRLENDGYNDDAAKSSRPGSEIPDLLQLWRDRTTSGYRADHRKHRFVSADEIRACDYDLSANFWLSGHRYPDHVPIHQIDEFFDVIKGDIPATAAKSGDYTFITSSEEPKRRDTWNRESESICIPTVSATGHGHASIKHIHYVNGKYSASTITAILTKRADREIYVPYVYYYLLSHKDELLVPLMRGAANVSLNLERLRKLRIPVPNDINEQISAVSEVLQRFEESKKLSEAANQAEADYRAAIIALKNQF